MAVYFLDTSALVKRYITETGTPWIRALCATNTIVISSIALAEMSSVFARRTREGSLSIGDRSAMLRLFQRHIEQYELVDIDRAVLNVAGSLLLNAPPAAALRSLDAIQLASTRAFSQSSIRSGLGPTTFVSADLRLLAAAQWAGFVTDNPDNHP